MARAPIYTVTENRSHDPSLERIRETLRRGQLLGTRRLLVREAEERAHGDAGEEGES